MKNIYIYILFLFLVASCTNLDEHGYSTTDSGIKYKLHYFGDGERTPVFNDVLLAHVVVKTLGDTVLYDSKWKHSMGFTKFKFNNTEGVNACFNLLRAGDSASFVVKNDHHNISSLYPEIDVTNKMVRLEIKLNGVYDLKEYALRLNDMSWLYDKEMKEQVAMKKYLDSLQLNKKNYVAGIYYQDLISGKGSCPIQGDAVAVHYKAYFLNGKEFDNTYGMDEPFVFNLGDPDQVIQGFETGVRLMKRNGKARFIIPSQLAFGDKGSATGIVPPFTTLVYEVELINII